MADWFDIPPVPVRGGGLGVLSVAVWPTYLGVAEHVSDYALREPTEHIDYERGMITWYDTVKGLGRAKVWLPKGEFTHFVFCSGPRDSVLNVSQMAMPLLFDRAGFIDVDPIRNTDVG